MYKTFSAKSDDLVISYINACDFWYALSVQTAESYNTCRDIIM